MGGAEDYFYKPCTNCKTPIDLDRACWMTWHGMCCTEGCARDLIKEWHGKATCGEDCKRALGLDG